MRVAFVMALLGRGSGEVVYECRNCGESVSGGTEVCSVCEFEGIARYEVD